MKEAANIVANVSGVDATDYELFIKRNMDYILKEYHTRDIKQDLTCILSSSIVADILDNWIYELFRGIDLSTEEDLREYNLFINGNWNKEEIKETWYDAISYPGNCYPLDAIFVKSMTTQLANNCLIYIYENINRIWIDYLDEIKEYNQEIG